jgi:hypothetical protein
MGLRKIASGLKAKAERVAMDKLIQFVIGGVASGRFGVPLQKAYEKARGYKTYTGVALGAIAYALESAGAAGICEPCGGYTDTLKSVAGVLILAGVLDAGYRVQPVPEATAPKK